MTQRDKKLSVLAVALLALMFLAPRLWLILGTSGSFIDEYWHLASAVDLIDHGQFGTLYSSGPYKRGAFVSLWLASWITIFGKSVDGAKISVLVFGLASYALLIAIAWRELERRTVFFVFACMLAFSPWLIFNHTYIRTYVFYEFATVLCVFLAYLYCRKVESWNFKQRPYMPLVLIGCLAVGMALFGFDTGAYAPLMIMSGFFGFLFVFHPAFFTTPDHHLVRAALASPYRRLLWLVLVASILVWTLDLWPKFLGLLVGDWEHGAAREHNYRVFLFEDNAVASTLFGITVLSIPWTQRPFLRALAVSVAVAFGIHLITAESAQVLRGIFYVLPLYYFLALVALDRMRFQVIGPAIAGFALAIAYSMVDQMPKEFFHRPSVPGIYYIDYQAAYDFSKQQCKGKTIIDASPGVHVSQYYDVFPTQVLIYEDSSELKNKMYVERNGRYYTYRSSIPVIHSLSERLTNTCVLVRKPSSKRFVSSRDEQVLAGAQQTGSFDNFTVYVFN